MADRDRKAAEKAAAAKAAALRDDDNVFDVSYENQGADAEGASTLSATDIKVRRLSEGGGGVVAGAGLAAGACAAQLAGQRTRSQRHHPSIPCAAACSNRHHPLPSPHHPPRCTT